MAGDRYVITPTRDTRGFGIIDRELYDYCGLPGEDGTTQPLVWKLHGSAEAWLNRCYRVWNAVESGALIRAEVLVPQGWRPAPPPLASPFDRGHRFYN